MKRNTLTLICLLVLFFIQSILFSQIAVKPEGEGTETSPFEIASLENLYWFSQKPGLWNRHYVQTQNIDASSTSTWNEGEGWESIGHFADWNDRSYFSGSYDGGGYSIKGLTINRPKSDDQGLFGVVLGATISNLVLEDVSIVGQNYVGGLFGRDRDGYFCYISNVSVSGSVKGNERVGLVAGSFYSGKISQSFSGGTVSGTEHSGGLIGYGNYIDITECFSTADVNGDGKSTGGLVGYLTSRSDIENCYSTGNVSSLHRGVGGLVGDIHNSTIETSYSIGKVSGGSWAGGLVGISFNNSMADNSFWDIEASTLEESDLGKGKSTVEMQDIQTFVSAGWDFKGIGENGIWNMDIDRNNGYPYFDWQFSNDAAGEE